MAQLARDCMNADKIQAMCACEFVCRRWVMERMQAVHGFEHTPQQVNFKAGICHLPLPKLPDISTGHYTKYIWCMHISLCILIIYICWRLWKISSRKFLENLFRSLEFPIHYTQSSRNLHLATARHCTNDNCPLHLLCCYFIHPSSLFHEALVSTSTLLRDRRLVRLQITLHHFPAVKHSWLISHDYIYHDLSFVTFEFIALHYIPFYITFISILPWLHFYIAFVMITDCLDPNLSFDTV